MTPNGASTAQMPSDGVKPTVAEAGGSTQTTVGSDNSKGVRQDSNDSPPMKDGNKPTDDCPASPQVLTQPYHYLPHLTPQPGAGYYLYGNPQVTPEPPSPATPGYDVASFLQQQAALGVHPGNPFGTTGQYGGIPQPPLSPSRTGMTGGLIPPASPLFPRAQGNPVTMSGSFEQPNNLDSSVLQRIQGQAPASPSVPYMSPSLGPSNGGGFSGVYQGYAAGTGTYASVLSGVSSSTNPSTAETSNSSEDKVWTDRNNSAQPQQPPQKQQQPQYPHPSPRQGPGLPGQYPAMSRAASNNRSYSFDEMLPPAVLDQQQQQDQASAPYSPYSTGQGASANTLFAHQQPWGYGASGDMYNPPQSPLQPRQTPHMAGHFPGAHPGMGPPMHHMGPYGGQQPMPPYYPATSPGPPIQTTASNKGPDGANLFIFHIPNHFTNLDMYRLFCQYGNLLSVRIMVEKDTGRSRGFGFVSYDSPESAALAIKELNGFAIGNKRLKVQHKQIRGDQRNSLSGAPHSGDPSFMPRPDLPTTGPSPSIGISPTPWYDAATKGPPSQPPSTEVTQDRQQDDIVGKPDDTTNPGVGKSPAGLSPLVGNSETSNAPGAVDLSPLASLEPLRSALPDVAGHAGTVE